MRGDREAAENSPVEFPYLRVRGDVALIGVSSARATAPFMATGDIRDRQARKLGKFSTRPANLAFSSDHDPPPARTRRSALA